MRKYRTIDGVWEKRHLLVFAALAVKAYLRHLLRTTAFRLLLKRLTCVIVHTDDNYVLAPRLYVYLAIINLTTEWWNTIVTDQFIFRG